VADFGTKVIFPRTALRPLGDAEETTDAALPRNISPGDYVRVLVTTANSETMKGTATAFTRLQPTAIS
jgi:hypothetical protein